MNKREAIERGHEIMGDAVINSCQEQVRLGCRGCCTDGSELFEYEALKSVPEGVEVTGRHIRNCLGPNGCKFPLEHKPLVCKMAPIVVVGVESDGQIVAFLDRETDCPARISPSFHVKVDASVDLLRKAKIWGNIEADLGISPGSA